MAEGLMPIGMFSRASLLSIKALPGDTGNPADYRTDICWPLDTRPGS